MYKVKKEYNIYNVCVFLFSAQMKREKKNTRWIRFRHLKTKKWSVISIENHFMRVDWNESAQYWIRQKKQIAQTHACIRRHLDWNRIFHVHYYYVVVLFFVYIIWFEWNFCANCKCDLSLYSRIYKLQSLTNESRHTWTNWREHNYNSNSNNEENKRKERQQQRKYTHTHTHKRHCKQSAHTKIKFNIERPHALHTHW